MDIGVISNRYAKALLKFSIEGHEEDTAYRAMQSVLQAFLSCPSLHRTLNNPALSTERKHRLFCAMMGEHISPSLQRFVLLVQRHRRTDLLQFIATSYIAQYRSYKRITKSTLTLPLSAASEDLTARIRRWVESRVSSTVELEVKTDTSLGGGFVLEYDTYRIDASLRHQLKEIEKSLLLARR